MTKDWILVSQSKRVTKAMERAGASGSAMVTKDGQTRHLWKIGSRWVDVNGTEYRLK